MRIIKYIFLFRANFGCLTFGLSENDLNFRLSRADFMALVFVYYILLLR